MPLNKGEYFTPNAMGHYEEGKQAVMVAAQQLGVGTDSLTKAGTAVASAVARTPVASRAAGISDVVAARMLPGEDDMSPGWIATDPTSHAHLPSAHLPSGVESRLERSGAVDDAATRGGGDDTRCGAQTYGGESAVATSEVVAMAAEPKLSIYDDWEGDDDDDFGGVI